MILYTHTHTHTHEDSLNENKKARQSNLELLRIFSMLLIVLHHYSYGNFTFSNDITTNKVIIQILLIGGKIGVNCFVLITGYFMINSKFKLKKLVSLIVQVFTYSIVFLFVGIALNMELDIKSVVKSILPIIHSQYWFITTYVVIYIFSDYINAFINQCSKKRLEKLMILLFVVQVIIPTFTGGKLGFSDVLWFITLYIIGAYIQKYPNNYTNGNKSKLALLSIFMIVLSILAFDIIGQKINFVSRHYDYFTYMNSIFIVISSICIFITFKNMNIKYNKFINVVASTMLGVYLIHANIFMRTIIWEDIFKISTFLNKSTIELIGNVIISVGSIMVFSIIIDLIRQKFIEPVEIKIIEKLSKKTLKFFRKNERVNKFINYINS